MSYLIEYYIMFKRYTFDNNINDDDEDEYFNNDCDESEMNKTSKPSANKSSNKEKALKVIQLKIFTITKNFFI
jgi:hypothetical protein